MKSTMNRMRENSQKFVIRQESKRIYLSAKINIFLSVFIYISSVLVCCEFVSSKKTKKKQLKEK